MRRLPITATVAVVLATGILLSGCGRLASLREGDRGSQPPAAGQRAPRRPPNRLDGSLAGLDGELAEADSATDEAAADLAAADRAAATLDEP